MLCEVRPPQDAATLAKLLPNLPMVIDHLAKPGIKDGRTDDWLPHLQAAAAFPNIYCKLSGLVTEADWQRWTVAEAERWLSPNLGYRTEDE